MCVQSLYDVSYVHFWSLCPEDGTRERLKMKFIHISWKYQNLCAYCGYLCGCKQCCLSDGSAVMMLLQCWQHALCVTSKTCQNMMDVLHGCDDDATIFFCLLSAGGLYELNAPMIQLTCYLPTNTAPLWRTAARAKPIHNSFCPVTVTSYRLYKTPVEPKRRMKQVDACCLDWVSQICSLTEGGGCGCGCVRPRSLLQLETGILRNLLG